MGDWALQLIQLDLTPAEAEELVHMVYELEVENNRLKIQYTDEKTGVQKRLPWDLR